MARTKPTAFRTDLLEPLAPATTAERVAADDSSVLPQSGYLTADYVKRRYSISNSTVYQWLANTRRGVGNGFPAPVKIGPRAVRWTAESLRAFEAALQAGE